MVQYLTSKARGGFDSCVILVNPLDLHWIIICDIISVLEVVSITMLECCCSMCWREEGLKKGAKL